ncbi:hypothetical protein ABZP36_010835 [Zizania latifolia]
MSVVLCGKRSPSIFTDELIPSSFPPHHRTSMCPRCSLARAFDDDAHCWKALLHHLLSFFPHMDPQCEEVNCVWVARKLPGFAFVDFDDRRDDQDAIRDLDEDLGVHSLIHSLLVHLGKRKKKTMKPKAEKKKRSFSKRAENQSPAYALGEIEEGSPGENELCTCARTKQDLQVSAIVCAVFQLSEETPCISAVVAVLAGAKTKDKATSWK